MVSKKNISLGEIAQLSQSAFSVISSSGFEIEANIAEIDIAKINLGQSAKVTLDAYGSLVEFPVKVAFDHNLEATISVIIVEEAGE